MCNFNTNVICTTEMTNRIICGDSLCVLKSYPDNCIDLILTSPLYNFNMEYDTLVIRQTILKKNFV